MIGVDGEWDLAGRKRFIHSVFLLTAEIESTLSDAPKLSIGSIVDDNGSQGWIPELTSFRRDESITETTKNMIT